jgi:hypothetical protein
MLRRLSLFSGVRLRYASMRCVHLQACRLARFHAFFRAGGLCMDRPIVMDVLDASRRACSCVSPGRGREMMSPRGAGLHAAF